MYSFHIYTLKQQTINNMTLEQTKKKDILQDTFVQSNSIF